MPDYSGMTYVLVSKRTVTNPHALLNPKRQLCGREPALYPDIRGALTTCKQVSAKQGHTEGHSNEFPYCALFRGIAPPKPPKSLLQVQA